MLDFLVLFGMDLPRISCSCHFFNFDPPYLPTLIVLVGGLLFSLGSLHRRYVNVAPLSVTPKSLSLFSFFCGEVH